MFSHHHHHHHLHGAVPVGTICAYAGVIASNAVVPEQQPVAHLERHGWLPCAGQKLPVAAYPELYGALGTLYNDGSEGEGCFRLPDCCGTFLRGVADGSENDPEWADRSGPSGAGTAKGAVGSTQHHATEYHTHDYTAYTASKVTAAEGEPVTVLNPAGTAKTGDMQVDYQSKKETRPVNIAVNFIIRAR